MRRTWRFALLAAAGLALSTGLSAPAHAASGPKPPPFSVDNVPAASVPVVAPAESGTFAISAGLIHNNLMTRTRAPGTVDHIADVHLSSGSGRIVATPDATTGDVSVTYFAAPPPSAAKTSGGAAVVTYDAVTTYLQGAKMRPTDITSAPATATIRIAPFSSDAPGVTLLAPGATAGNGTVVVAGGLQNIDEFAQSSVPVSAAGFSEAFQASAHSTTCDITVAAPAVSVGQGGTGTFALRADPGSWVLTVRSLTTGLVTQRAFTVPRIGTVRYCTPTASVLGITVTGFSGSSGPQYVSPYGGTANGALPQGTPVPQATSSTGYSAAVQADQNPAYDAAQAAAGATGCHAVGTGANAHFVGCDDITASPGTADTGNVLTGTPAIVAYVIVFLLALLLLGGLARRARTSA